MTSLLCIPIGSHTNTTFLDTDWFKITMAHRCGLTHVDSSLCGPIHPNRLDLEKLHPVRHIMKIKQNHCDSFSQFRLTDFLNLNVFQLHKFIQGYRGT